MNLKQLSILIVLVVLIGGAGLYFYQQKNASFQSGERTAAKKLLGDFPVNDVAQVVIKQNKSELNLGKQDDLWRVRERYNYPANFSEISDFLRKLWELRGIQRIPAGKSQLGRLELTDPGQGTNSGTLVEFKDKSGKLIRSLVLGKKHEHQSQGASPFGGDFGGYPDGRFLLVSDNSPDPNVWIVSEAFSSIEAKPESWLNKDFIKVEKIRSVSVTSTNATNSWKLTRDTESGEFKLADRKPGEELDTGKTSGLNYLLSSPTFTDVLSPDAKPETSGMDKPTLAVLDTFDNFKYTVQIGKQTNEDCTLRVKVTADFPKERVAGKDEKPEDKTKLDKEFKEKQDKLKDKLKQDQAFEKWTYVVGKYTVDQLLKQRADLLAPPKETNAVPVKPGEPGKPGEKLPDLTAPPPIPMTNAPMVITTNAPSALTTNVPPKLKPIPLAPAPVPGTNAPKVAPGKTNATSAFLTPANPPVAPPTAAAVAKGTNSPASTNAPSAPPVLKPEPSKSAPK